MSYFRIVVFAIIIYFFTLRTSLAYTCSTPDEWLWNAGIKKASKTSHDNILGANTRAGQLWPRGIVKYKLHSSLTEPDKKQVFAAFEEFHNKTCIRFEPYSYGDPAYVSIEMNNSVCGEAHVCMQGGYQFAQFGQKCRNKQTMVHELGHTICLGHEHQRSDRDDYVTYIYCDTTDSDISVKTGYKAKGIYDYNSQMHYECEKCSGGIPTNANVKKCGPQITPGLSVLDVDTINELYNCTGCYRHRWVPIELLQDTDLESMFNFGFTDWQDGPIYPCRARINNVLAIGKFEFTNKVCHVAWEGREHFPKARFEVLTIPGGLRTTNSEYMLTKFNNPFGDNKKDEHLTILETAVVSGHLDSELKSGYEKGYVAYSVVHGNSQAKFCGSKDVSTSFTTVGGIYESKTSFVGRLPICGNSTNSNANFVLTCIDRTGWQHVDRYRSRFVQHIKTFRQPLVPGSQITIVGHIPHDAKVFHLEFEDQLGFVPVLFYFSVRFDWYSDKNVIVRNSQNVDAKWDANEFEKPGENFPFEKNSIVTMVIKCEANQFVVSVNNYTAVIFKYRLPLERAKVLVIQGDIHVIEMNGVNVEGEQGYYRRSFKGLQKFYFPGNWTLTSNEKTSITTESGFTSGTAGSGSTSSTAGSGSTSSTTESGSTSSTTESGSTSSTTESGSTLNDSIEILHAVTPSNDNSSNAPDPANGNNWGHNYFMLGLGIGAAILVVLFLGAILGKLFTRKTDYSGIPVAYTQH